MRLYTPEGWLDAGAIRSGALPFTWIWGGRGIGKTFGFLKSVRYDNPAPFILLRRTQTMIDLMSNPMFSPFLAVDDFVGGLTAVQPLNKYITAFYEGEKNDDGKIVPVGSPVGYAAALSTIHNIRGFSSDAEYLIYDEFIPERHERPIREEYAAFQNAYETINRNRELEGRRPLISIALTNANHLANPYFTGMKVVKIVDKMLSTRREVYTLPDRGIMLINIVGSPISDRKSKTSLYRMSGEGTFADMALGNEFAGESRGKIRSVNLRECVPVVAVEDGRSFVAIYRIKSGGYYVTNHVSGTPPVYGSDDADLARFRKRYFVVWDRYLSAGGKIYFSDYEVEVNFRKIFGANY